MKTKFVIASDHAGFSLKQKLQESFSMIEFVDLGPDSENSVDYPDFANKLADYLKNNPEYYGILICGSGIGISIAANRHNHIRAALCSDKEIAKLARNHNDANVLVLGARFCSVQQATEILNNFATSEFESGRHQTRIDKLS